jgi:hypothetical protein
MNRSLRRWRKRAAAPRHTQVDSTALDQEQQQRHQRSSSGTAGALVETAEVVWPMTWKCWRKLAASRAAGPRGAGRARASGADGALRPHR